MEKIDIEGYKQVLDATLNDSRIMLSLLKGKVAAIDKALETREANSDLVSINYRIDKIKANSEIKVLERITADKEKYFVKYFKEFEVDAAQCNRDWDFVFTAAKTESAKNELLKKIIGTMDMDKVAQEPEIKIGYFKTFKKQLNGKV
jgi:hypothetical protein